MEKQVEEWIEKVEESKGGDVDLSRDEDLAIGLMNLVSLEEHFYFTAMKTGNRKYLEMLNSVRDMRKTLLEIIVTDPVGEEWCISKHLLAASKRLEEVGTKELYKGHTERAERMFTFAFDLFSLFFAINMKMIGMEEIEEGDLEGEENQMTRKFSEIVKSIVDCCKEW